LSPVCISKPCFVVEFICVVFVNLKESLFWLGLGAARFPLWSDWLGVIFWCVGQIVRPSSRERFTQLHPTVSSPRFFLALHSLHAEWPRLAEICCIHPLIPSRAAKRPLWLLSLRCCNARPRCTRRPDRTRGSISSRYSRSSTSSKVRNHATSQ